MKNIMMKINLPALLTLLLSLGLMSGSFAQRTAMAGRIDTVPALQISVNKNLVGQYLHVLYVVGRPGFLSLGPVPYVDIIRAQSQAQVIKSEVVTFPAVQIEKTPGRGSYNMIVFAVSSSAQINWVNVDVNPNPTTYKFLNVIQKPFIDSFIAEQGEAQTLPISL